MIFMIRSDVIFTAGSNYVTASRSYGHVLITISDRGFNMDFIVEIVLGRYHRKRGIGVAPTTPILIYFYKKNTYN